MIDTNELMRGNKVIVGKGSDWEEIAIIDEIFDNAISLQGREFTTYATVLDPIPISEELLLKNGFTKKLLIEGNEKYDDWVEFEKDFGKFVLSIRHCSNSIERDWSVHIDNDYRCGVGGMDIEYVHQLQNIVKIAGYEIELKV